MASEQALAYTGFGIRMGKDERLIRIIMYEVAQQGLCRVGGMVTGWRGPPEAVKVTWCERACLGVRGGQLARMYIHVVSRLVVGHRVLDTYVNKFIVRHTCVSTSAP